MTDHSVSRYFEFYRVNLNGEKNTEWFLGSNLQCCLHATVLLAVKFSAELNNYIMLMRDICEKYRFRGQEKIRSPHRWLGIFASPLNRYFSQITLTNRIYLYSILVSNTISISSNRVQGWPYLNISIIQLYSQKSKNYKFHKTSWSLFYVIILYIVE